MHVTVADARDAAGALAEAKACLEKHYNIHHSTIQVEIGEECPDMGAVSDDAHEHAHNHEKAHRGGSMKTQSGAAAFAAD